MTPAQADKAVEAAYFGISDGARDVRVRLSDLRVALWRMTRREQDAALRRLHAAGRADFFPLDNPRERDAQDDAAAIAYGVPQHVMYFRGHGGARYCGLIELVKKRSFVAVKCVGAKRERKGRAKCFRDADGEERFKLTCPAPRSLARYRR